MTMIQTLLERLKAKSIIEGECWLWTGFKGAHGYGITSVRSTNQLVHRAAYTEFIGPIPEGMNVLHRCDRRACWNPAHLFVGSHADNVADKIAKGRLYSGARHQWTGRAYNGDLHPSSKLSEVDVCDIRILVGWGLSHHAVAAEYGVTPSCISRRLSGVRGERKSPY
jgi:hypothetical protein